jgi:hypothetical protein
LGLSRLGGLFSCSYTVLFGGLELPPGCGQAPGKLSGLLLLLLESRRDRLLLLLLDSEDLCSGGLKLLTRDSKVLRERLGTLLLLNMCFAQLRHVGLGRLCGFPESYSGVLLCDLKLLTRSREFLCYGVSLSALVRQGLSHICQIAVAASEGFALGCRWLRIPPLGDCSHRTCDRSPFGAREGLCQRVCRES